MQTVLEQGSIDKPLTFDVGLIQLSFYQCVHLIHATFQSNCAEGLQHFSAFHFIGSNIYHLCMHVVFYFLLLLRMIVSAELLVRGSRGLDSAKLWHTALLQVLFISTEGPVKSILVPSYSC